MEEDFPIYLAIKQVQAGDLSGARKTLQLSNEIEDDLLIEGLRNIDKGLTHLFTQETVQALEPLQTGFKVFEYSSNEALKFIIESLINYSDGITKLFSSDTQGAIASLKLSSEAWDEISFYFPHFKINSLAAESAIYLAEAKGFMNVGNITAAENSLGFQKNIHDKLLAQLDISNPEHIAHFVEIYGTRLELAIGFAITLGIPTLDLKTVERRFDDIREDLGSLKNFLGKMNAGEIKSVCSTYVLLYEIIDILVDSLKILLFEHRPFNKNEVEALVNVEHKIYEASKTAQTCGNRKSGATMVCSQVSKLHTNLLTAGKVATKGYSRKSQTLSFCAFLILFVLVEFTSGMSLSYFIGVLLFSLIVGFGYGATRFTPLLKLFTDAINRKQSDSNT